MLVIGASKDENGKEYLIGRNSFGINWGENGLFRIYRDSEKINTYFLETSGYLPNIMPINNVSGEGTMVQSRYQL